MHLVSFQEFDANIFRFILYRFIPYLYKNYMMTIKYLYYNSTLIIYLSQKQIDESILPLLFIFCIKKHIFVHTTSP